MDQIEQITNGKPFNPRTIPAVNLIGLRTLVYKEVGRFLNVYSQTIIAPVVTTLMYFAVFALAFGGLAMHQGDRPYLEFLAPGLIIMTMVQNAFANTSSSIVIAKVQGNIVDVLMPPLSSWELFVGYLCGGVLRGLMVGTVCTLVLSLFTHVPIANIGTIFLYAILGTSFMAMLGMAGGLWSEKFDHIAAVTNFVVTPMTFLSGTFYSIDQLPPFWAKLAHFNPFFYVIDGFRSGFTGTVDAGWGMGLWLLIAVNVGLAALVLWMLRTGYKIKS